MEVRICYSRPRAHAFEELLGAECWVNRIQIEYGLGEGRDSNPLLCY